MTRAAQVALVVGVLAGLGFGWIVGQRRGGSGEAPPNRATPSASAHAGPSLAGLEGSVGIAAVDAGVSKSAAAVPELTPPAVPGHLAGWLDSVASRHRTQAQGRHAQARETARHLVHRQRRTARDEALDRKRGGPLASFVVGRTATQLNALRSDPEAFAKLFTSHESGGTVRVQRNGLFPSLAPGDTVNLPSGVHALDLKEVQQWLDGPGTPSFPADLTFDGSSMDFCLLVLRGEMRASAAIQNLAFRDMTIWCDGSLLNARAPYTLQLERCRIVSFDHVVMSGERGAIWARNCRIESGFGGRTFRLGDLDRWENSLARWEDCTFVGPFSRRLPPDHVFVRCVFEDLGPLPKVNEQAAQFQDCTFRYLSAEDDDAKRRGRDIRELHRGWRLPR